MIYFFDYFRLIIKAFVQLCYGYWKILHTKSPRVTIFGGSRIPPIKELYQQAHELAHALAHKKTCIITGGGPGIMEAASCGTTHVKNGFNIGIGIKSLNSKKNLHLSDYIEIDTFFVRKHLLRAFSCAFIVFPGGYGTIDELFEILNLIKVNHMNQVPVILVNKKYWQGMINWLNDQVVTMHAIKAEDIQFMSIVDTNEEILEILNKTIYHS